MAVKMILSELAS